MENNAATTAENIKVASTHDNGVRFADGNFVAWRVLEAAAQQPERDLATIYRQILTDAKKQNAQRLIPEDWKLYGFPLRTGYGKQYDGQCVRLAWEIRRKTVNGADSRIAYIVRYDRSETNRVTRTASPAFATYEEAMDWVSENYRGGWHDEAGVESTYASFIY